MLLPLSLKIGRGFYEDGIWTEGGFMPYSRIGGMTWREEDQLTLVLMYRMRSVARRLVVPERYPSTRDWARPSSRRTSTPS